MLVSRTVSVSIFCDPADAYAFVRNPDNLSRWATGLGGGARQEDGQCVIELPSGGRATLRFAADNPFGILDHAITTADGTTTHVPMRVLPNDDGCEVLVTLFQPQTMTEREFSRDVSWVRRDLESLREALET